MPDKDPTSRQSILADQFFYFFLRLRKERIREIVQVVNDRYPNEPPEQKARRLIATQTPLSFLGGTLMHLPEIIPGIGQAIKVLGFVGGASAVTRMHLYLILEIALLYGKDIDDEARVSEMLAVVAATGLAAGVPLLASALSINPLVSIPAAGVTAYAAAQLIGEQAIRFYAGPALEAPPSAPAIA
jgi:hypothetical protein